MNGSASWSTGATSSCGVCGWRSSAATAWRARASSALERHVRRAARTPALEPGPDAAAAAAGLLLVAGCGSCEPIPEGPDGCRSSDTLPAAGPDDDDDSVAVHSVAAVGPGDAAAVDARSRRRCGPGFEQDVTSPRKKKLRTVELTVVAQTEHVANNIFLISLFSPSPRPICHRTVIMWCTCSAALPGMWGKRVTRDLFPGGWRLDP